jgi:hypothetical protein
MTVPPNPDGTRSPLLFALKCPSRQPAVPICKRVRVFSALDLGSGPAVSEVPAVIPNFTFIYSLAKLPGAPRKVARFLTMGCDLYMLGRMEPDPEGRDAAYAGSAVQLRKGAELFLGRCILRHTGPLPKVSGPGGMFDMLDRALPPTIGSKLARLRVGQHLRFIFDVGDIHAHPEPGAARLKNKVSRWPATRGTIEQCLNRFERAYRLVRI